MGEWPAERVDPLLGQRLLTITSEWWEQPLIVIGALAEVQGSGLKDAQSWPHNHPTNAVLSSAMPPNGMHLSSKASLIRITIA
jgi:hypothetical protein